MDRPKIGGSLLAAVAVIVAAPDAWAEPVVMATGGTPAELRVALDALGGAGVVVVPPGEWEVAEPVPIAWAGTVLIGSGAANTRLFRTTELDGGFLTSTDLDDVRVAELTIEGNRAASSAAHEVGVYVKNASGFRVDHCRLSFLGSTGVQAVASTGVVDHCTITDGFKPAIANFGYGVAVYGDGTYSGLPFGTDDAVFIESNEISGARHASASNAGARYVFRDNHVFANEYSHAIDAHGDEYNSVDVGTEWIEVYRNVVEAPVYVRFAVRIRGGAGAIWSNTIRGYEVAVGLIEETPQPTGMVYIWDNTLSSGTQVVDPSTTDSTSGLEANGRPDFVRSAPAGYTAYVSPHPLVTDLQAVAGPDQGVVLPAGGGPAPVWVDATATTAGAGSVVAHRWYLDGALASECARDVLGVAGEGAHVLLLVAERDDGLWEVDTAVARVAPAGPLASSTAWASSWFVPVVGAGAVSMTVTPSTAGQDAYVALAGRRVVGVHTDQAILIRTANTGQFDARNGDAYEALAIVPYTAGRTYQVEIAFDLASQTYDASIDGTVIADGYAFRVAETELSQVTAWHSTGSLSVDGISIDGARLEPDPACRPGPDGDADADADADAGADADGDGDADADADGDGDADADGDDDDRVLSGGCGCSEAGARGAASWTGRLGRGLAAD